MNTRSASSLRSFLLVVILCLVPAGNVRAQTSMTIRGRVLDQARQPVSGQEVLLHRVAGQDGARIGQATTAEDGTFSFRIEEEAATGAVYFATARFEGEVFIGPFLETPIEPGSDYEVIVGGEPINFNAPVLPAGSAAGASVRPPVSPRQRALGLVLLVAVVGVGFALLSRRGKRNRRQLLIRLAVLEEEAAERGESDTLREERARILDQLGGRSGD